MSLIVHRISFVLAWAFALFFVCGFLRMAAKDEFIPEGFLTGVFSWAIIFAIISYNTRPPQPVNRQSDESDDTPESN
jgi:hypothetical protein